MRIYKMIHPVRIVKPSGVQGAALRVPYDRATPSIEAWGTLLPQNRPPSRPGKQSAALARLTGAHSAAAAAPFRGHPFLVLTSGAASAAHYVAGHSRVYLRESLPASVEEIDLLVVMGGPQSPASTKKDCPYFDAAAEQALIRSAVAAGKAVVGVCLGAQLIGEALGAKYSKSPCTEIGMFQIALTDSAMINLFTSAERWTSAIGTMICQD